MTNNYHAEQCESSKMFSLSPEHAKFLRNSVNRFPKREKKKTIYT